MKNSFFLVIPEQEDSLELLARYKKESVNQWLSELPTANPNLVARLFYNFVEDSNKIKMTAQQRLDVLEQLRPAFLNVEEFLRSRLMLSNFPKGDSEQKIFSFLISIELNFTIGYWIITRELTIRNSKWFQGKNIAIAIQRTIKGLSEIVITHYLMFLTAPEWVWIDLHSLYKLSLKTKKESVRVADAARFPVKVNTVEESYKQILLLSLANPAGLMQKEIGPIYKFIGNICQMVKIESQPVNNQEKQCIILMDEDNGPFFDLTGVATDSSVMYLDLLKLYKIKKLPNEFSNILDIRYSIIPVQNPSKKMPAILFEYIQQYWEGEGDVGIPFFEDRLDRYLAVGVQATHSLQSDLLTASSDSGEMVAKSFSDRELSCKFEEENVLSIGTLISYRKKTEPRDKRVLGIVKKIAVQAKERKKIVFEVSVITPFFYPVTYINVSATLNSYKYKALLYGVKSNEGEKSFIIIESFNYKNDDGMRVFMHGKHFPVVLGDRKNIGQDCWQFECRKIEEKQVSQVIKKKKV